MDVEATWEDAFTMRLRDKRKSHSPKEKDRQFKHDLREAPRDARLRMITRKDYREDAAKGIDKTAFAAPVSIQTAHAVATRTPESNTHKRSLDVRCETQGRKGGVWCVPSMWRGTRDPGPRVEMPREAVRSNQRKVLDEEERGTEERIKIHTNDAAPPEKRGTHHVWHERDRKEDEVCAHNCGGEDERRDGRRKRWN